MWRPIRGQRYVDEANSWLIEWIETRIPFMDMEGALAFYTFFLTQGARPKDQALLACNDRFFMGVHLLGRRDLAHPWLYDRCREVEADPDGYIDLWAREHYKAGVLTQIIPTPKGYRKFGDIAIGDYVFGPDGKPTRVIAQTPIFHDADCYRVVFDKGEEIIVSGDHLWTVGLHSKPRVKGAPLNAPRPAVRVEKTINTRELAQEVAKANARKSKFYPSVKVCAPLEYQERDLPIDPYLLGLYLGDGCSTGAQIGKPTEDIEVFAGHVRAAGEAVSIIADDRGLSRMRVLATGGKGTSFTARLSPIGVLGMGNKHIPDAYLTASIAQRRALLQGLMDTDGSCDARGTVIFCNATERLARDTFKLAASLGLKPSLRSYESQYDGKPYQYWQVAFQAYDDDPPVFRLARKQSGAVKRPENGNRSSFHMVVDVQPVDSAPCRCIQIDREDGLYLVGEQCIATHNSTIITYMGIIQEVMADPEMCVLILSFKKQIAQKFLSQIMRDLERNPDLRECFPDVLWEKPRVEAPQWSKALGVVVKRKGNPSDPTILASGLVDGMPTGGHFNLMVYDDVVTKESVTNPEMVAATTEAWELSDNLGAGDVRVWMPGTRYSFADTYGQILERGAMKPRLYPATEDGTMNGRLVFMSAERWEDKKKKQRSTLAAQMLQNPLSGKENMFEPQWLCKWEVRPEILHVYIMVDPASSKRKQNDRTAMAVIGVAANGKKFLLDGVCHRMSLYERWKMLRMLWLKWSSARGVRMIKVGYEKYGMQSDIEFIQLEMQKPGEPVFEIIEVNIVEGGVANQAKKARVGRLEPDIRNGDFLLPALIFVPGKGACFWSINKQNNHLSFDPVKRTLPNGAVIEGLTRNMRAMIANGFGHLVAQTIERKNEDGKPYDATRELIDEIIFFPFSPRDDFVDCCSRIYDMGVTYPDPTEQGNETPIAVEYEDS